MKIEHYAMIGGVVLLAVLLYANRGCSACKTKFNAIANASGAFPGGGRGVAVNPGMVG